MEAYNLTDEQKRILRAIAEAYLRSPQEEFCLASGSTELRQQDVVVTTGVTAADLYALDDENLLKRWKREDGGHQCKPTQRGLDAVRNGFRSPAPPPPVTLAEPTTNRGVASLKPAETVSPKPNSTDSRNVFVVHGRNLEARNSLFRFLRSVGLRPLEWSQAIQLTGKASPFIGEILDVAFSSAQAVVVLMTPDDVAQLQERFRSQHDPSYESQLTGQARPNVLFEAGMAMGRNPDRTIIVELGTVRPFSDIAGRNTVRLSNNSASRQELAQRLETAGCPVDLSGRDWHTEGDFDTARGPNP